MKSSTQAYLSYDDYTRTLTISFIGGSSISDLSLKIDEHDNLQLIGDTIINMDLERKRKDQERFEAGKDKVTAGTTIQVMPNVYQDPPVYVWEDQAAVVQEPDVHPPMHRFNANWMDQMAPIPRQVFYPPQIRRHGP